MGSERDFWDNAGGACHHRCWLADHAKPMLDFLHQIVLSARTAARCTLYSWLPRPSCSFHNVQLLGPGGKQDHTKDAEPCRIIAARRAMFRSCFWLQPVRRSDNAERVEELQ